MYPRPIRRLRVPTQSSLVRNAVPTPVATTVATGLDGCRSFPVRRNHDSRILGHCGLWLCLRAAWNSWMLGQREPFRGGLPDLRQQVFVLVMNEHERRLTAGRVE